MKNTYITSNDRHVLESSISLEKYAQQLPADLCITITNAGAIVIMGRDNNLTLEQKADFEVVKI